jgi:hypothetical protein
MKLIYHDKEFDLSEVSDSSIFWKITELLPIAVKHHGQLGNELIQNSYRDKELLSTALEYVELNIAEMVGVSSLGILTLEIQSTLYRSLYLSISGFYKEAFLNLRSSIELSMFLTTEHVKDENIPADDDALRYLNQRFRDIRKWLRSETDMPRMSEFVKVYWNNKVFKDLLKSTDFKNQFNVLYDKLHDYAHTKGLENTHYQLHDGYRELEFPPAYNEKALLGYLELFIETVQIIAIITAATRIELLDEKLATRIEETIKEPLIGTGFWGGLVDIFFRLVPDSYKTFFTKYWVKS